jgi:hypothetical protein
VNRFGWGSGPRLARARGQPHSKCPPWDAGTYVARRVALAPSGLSWIHMCMYYVPCVLRHSHHVVGGTTESLAPPFRTPVEFRGVLRHGLAVPFGMPPGAATHLRVGTHCASERDLNTSYVIFHAPALVRETSTLATSSFTHLR